MKDIDFDELDRAVNSIIGDEKDTKPSAAPVVPASDPKPVQASPKSADAPVSASDATPLTPAPAPSPRITGVAATAPRSPSPASRRGGRFMDVVHPSSDMKQATPAPSAAAPRKPVIAPIHSDVTPSSAASEPLVSAPAEPKATEPAALPESKAHESSAKSPAEWPDPLDILSSDDKPSQPAETHEKADAPSELDELVETSKLGAETPQTPFLSDTKVEKRPLGAFADGHSEPPSYTEVAEFEAAEAAKHEQDAQLEPETVLPPEYQPDLVAIEAKEQVIIEGEIDEPQDAPKERHETAHESQPVSDVKPEPAPEAKAEPVKEAPKPDSVPEEKPVAAEPASSPVVGSIAPQYRAADLPADAEELHAVFDTEAYHQPLLPSKTHRRTPVWAWILLAIGLLVVGGGVGALLFILGY